MKIQEIPQLDLSVMDDVAGLDAIDNDLMVFDGENGLPNCLEGPMRLADAVVVVCIEGTACISVNMQDYVLERGHMPLLLPEQVIQRKDHHLSAKALFVGVSSEYINALGMDVQTQLNMFFYVRENPVTILTEKELELLREYHEFVRMRLRDKENAFRKEVSHHLICAMFYEMLKIITRHSPQQRRLKSRREDLFDQFIRLVAEYYKKERFVLFYADKLCITSKYLAQVVRDVSGLSANAWIDRYVLLEAQTLLKNTSLTIQEIADSLGFPNQSFFGRYFKKHIGVSPREYR